MEERVLKAALAGLLHDIGKFSQRAGIGSTRTWDSEAENEYRYAHAVFSGDFVERFVPEAFKPLSPPAYHHVPKSDFDRLVQLADRLSAGERDPDDQRYPRQLLSIFCRIAVKEETELLAPSDRYHALVPLALNDTTLFPAELADRADDADRYKTLWDGEERNSPWPGFIKDAEALRKAHEPQADVATYLESMLLLMQRYTWCIPSAYYNNVPDVSLHDHSRTTAAVAACLTAHSGAQIQHWLDGQNQDVVVALLVGGDISGIQDFIYTITSKGAVSALRGRSLYLQLLTDAIARYVLQKLELPITNLLYAGGGHFFLLARSTDSGKLDDIRRDVSRILLAFHSGDLYLALASVPLAAQDFVGEVLSDRWRQLSAELRRAKTRKFSELEDSMHGLVFQLQHDRGNEEDECQVCGREHPEARPKRPPAGEARKCPQCRDFEELGRDLREARYLRLSQVELADVEQFAKAPPGRVEDALHCFGMMPKLYESVSEIEEDKGTVEKAHHSVIYALRDDALDTLKPGARTAVGRRFFVNVTPVIADAPELERLRETGVTELPEVHDVKPFEALEAESEGLKRMGVLRMDVDNMGRIIGEGLGERATLSRIATLSFMINLFFEGWAAEMARRYNREGGTETDRLYSIYSGGDDLFFVGAWDVMPELALDIRNDLQRFVAGHLGIHASAGITLIGGKYPLYQAAEDAKVVLEQSKARDGKNAVTFLGQTVEWQKFADDVRPTADRLRDVVEQNNAPRALLQRLYQLYRLYDDKAKQMKDRGEGENKAGEEQVYWGPWHWRAAYVLRRMADRHEKARKEIEEIHSNLSGENFRAIEWIGLAARWADLLTR